MKNYFIGKERVTPDSQIVEFTPNGHSANVNNTHNSSVYLTYRRATEVSPPNEKVVMDICVVVTTKGDTGLFLFLKTILMNRNLETDNQNLRLHKWPFYDNF